MIKNIIFDLGAVLLNLDISKTEVAFRALLGSRELHTDVTQKLHLENFFEKFETNEIEENEFVATLKTQSRHPLSTEQINTAWSSMLLNFPAERIELLKRLRSKGYRVFLLSNINSIHLRDVYTIIREEHGNIDFDALFEKPYYSHLIGRRKPNPDTYHFVLEDAGLKAEETLFIDDNADNIRTAAEIGINTILHVANSDVVKVLEDYLGFEQKN